MDTTFLCFYSIGLFISGSLCDHYNPKYLLIGSFMIVSLVVTAIAVSAELGYINLFLFCLLFSINGFMQSFGWPACTAIFANWFGKRGRGAIVGLWCSSGNAGNVMGALLTSFLTSSLLYNWR